MPENRIMTRPYALVTACGLALAAACPAVGQSDPLSEPFPAVLELSDLDGVIGFTIPGLNPGERTGFSVARAGDVNGDGHDDIIVGAYRASVGGRTYVIFGRAEGNAFPSQLDLSVLDGTNGFRVDGFDAFGQSGFSVAAAGDINRDGVDDIIIGDPGGSRAFVVFGRASAIDPFPPTISLSGLDGTDGFRMDGMDRFTFAGIRVAAAGDINGDGIDDVVVGDNSATIAGIGASAGVCYVVFGRDTGAMGPFPATLKLDHLDGQDGFAIHAVNQWDRLGLCAGVGDINHDGIDDLALGAPGADPGGRNGAGAAYVVFGKNTVTSGPFPAKFHLADLDAIDGFVMEGLNPHDMVGPVASAGDVNLDGIDDLLVGAPGGYGQTYVIFGRDEALSGGFGETLNLDSLDGEIGFRLTGIERPYGSGSTISGGGDINGDGIDDIIIGTRLPNESHVVFGRSAAAGSVFPSTLSLADLDGRQGFTMDGITPYDHAGRAVASAGDINGDGMPDVIVGASRADPDGRLLAGQAFVVFGRRPTTCPPDLDADGALTIFDFLAFGNLFDDMDPRADFDGDGDFTIFDFLAFQHAFDAGCP